MPATARKIVGTILLVAFVTFYALAAMTIAAAKLPGASGWVQLVFYVVAGLVWVIPAGVLVAWMQRPNRRPS